METTAEIAEKFGQSTTAHGWGRATRARFRWLQGLWVGITVTALALNAGHITLLVGSYLSYNTEIRWQIRVSEIAFPSVTVCNTQAMSQSSKGEMLQDKHTKLYEWQRILDTIDTFDELAARLNQTEEFERIKYKLREPSGYFQNIGDEYKKVGHQLDDFVLGCTYGMQECSSQNFSTFHTQDYFNCYTFNSGKESLIAKTTGPNAGLSLVLYVETDNGDGMNANHYNRYLSTGDAAGLRVVIHPPNSRPYPLEQGFDVPPGISASVNMVVQLNTRLDNPYGHCIGEIWPQKVGQYNFNYTMSDCLLICKQLYVLDTCGCLSSLLPTMIKEVQYCSQWNVHNITDLQVYFTKVTCEHDALLSFPTHRMLDECGCQASCEIYQYMTDVSYSEWPITSSQSAFYQTYVLEHPNATTLKAYKNLVPHNTTVERGMIDKNFVRLNVYIQEPIVNIHSQKASYTLTKLTSDVGGTFGLWIGMSLITWCEVLEFLMALFLAQVAKFRFKRGKVETSLSVSFDKEDQHSIQE